MLIERFSLGVTAKAPWTKINRKSAISLQRGQFDPKFQVEGVSPTNHFRKDIVRPVNVLQLCRWQFLQRNFVADFLQAKCDYIPQSAVLSFWGSF